MESGETGILFSASDETPAVISPSTAPQPIPQATAPELSVTSGSPPSTLSPPAWGSGSSGRVPVSPRTPLLSRDKKVEAIIKMRKGTQKDKDKDNKDGIVGISSPSSGGRDNSQGSGIKPRTTLRASNDVSSNSIKYAEPAKRGTILTAFQSVFEKFSTHTPQQEVPNLSTSPTSDAENHRPSELANGEENAEEIDLKRWESPSEEELQASELIVRRRRQKVIDEIITTEVTYIANLEYCRDQLLIPLRRMSAEEKWRKMCPAITIQDISVMFSNLEKLIPLNQALLETLLDHMTRSDLPLLQARVGHIFSEYAPQFKFYSVYITNYHFSIDTLKKCEKNKYFCQAVRELGVDIGGGSVQLKSFLIMPIQRIPRYELFLRDLLKYTPEDHFDRPSLEQALQAIMALASELDVNKVKIDNMEKLLEISQNISKAPFNIVEPTRRLIREGVLRKLWGQGGSLSNFIDMRTRQKHKTPRVDEYVFFLFNDLLLCVQPKAASVEKGQHPKNSYRYVSSFSWDSRVNVGHNFEVVDIPESEVVAFGFRLIYKRNTDEEVLNELALAASSIEEKKDWMQDIDAQIKSTLSSRLQGLGSRHSDGGTKDSALAPICFGFLCKRGGKRKSWKRRYFQLKGNTIFYYAEPQQSEALGRVWLPEYRLEVAPRSIVGNKEFCFCLFHTQGGRNYYFEADSLEELNKWVGHIQTCQVPISEGLRQYLADAASSYQSLLTT